MDITLNKRMDPTALLEELAKLVPEGFRVFGVEEVPLKASSLMSTVAGMDYVIIVDGPPEDWEPAIAGLLVRDVIEVSRRTKRKKRRRGPPTRMVDIRPNITSITVEAAGNEQSIIRVALKTIDRRGAKIREVLEVMGADFSKAQTVRVNTRFIEEMGLGDMAEGKGEAFASALPPTPNSQGIG